jgi:hypothetical protein
MKSFLEFIIEGTIAHPEAVRALTKLATAHEVEASSPKIHPDLANVHRNDASDASLAAHHLARGDYKSLASHVNIMDTGPRDDIQNTIYKHAPDAYKAAGWKRIHNEAKNTDAKGNAISPMRSDMNTRIPKSEKEFNKKWDKSEKKYPNVKDEPGIDEAIDPNLAKQQAQSKVVQAKAQYGANSPQHKAALKRYNELAKPHNS